MAIINGNTNFNLKLSRSGDKGLTVSWSKSGGIGYGNRIQIFDGYGKLAHTKEYAQTDTKGSFTFQCSYYGEFKVFIQSGTYMTDWAYIPIYLTTIKKQPYTYTAADIKNIQNTGNFITGILATIGVYLKVTSTLLTIGFGTTNVAAEQKVKLPTPRAGDVLTTTLTPKTGGVETVVSLLSKAYTDPSGGSQSEYTTHFQLLSRNTLYTHDNTKKALIFKCLF
ncbi:hypothetical protein [Lysinibacillus sp. NPDC056185]|uniref:hypothetical protein n=1 Tax=Lysinibacillus sp. NPDC056185 TaxID=3345739 RepID=UPI0039EF74FF